MPDSLGVALATFRPEPGDVIVLRGDFDGFEHSDIEKLTEPLRAQFPDHRVMVIDAEMELTTVRELLEAGATYQQTNAEATTPAGRLAPRPRTLLVAATIEDGEIVRRELGLTPDEARIWSTSGRAPLHGMYFHRVVWCRGWDRGTRADHYEAFIRRNVLAKLRDVEEVRL